MYRTSNKYLALCVYVVLGLATLVVYWPVVNHEFVKYDDDQYVTENRHVNGGMTRESVIWAFTTPHGGTSYWHPLTWLSHMLDCQLYELDARWHHFTSLLFHIANTLLLFWVLKRMTGAVWASGFVAVVFSLHPLHVESVAWVAERKDVLSGFFWMLTMAAYVRYAERPGVWRYVPVLVGLCLGLMAKPMVVSLPFVLLLLDYWPLERFQWGRSAWRLIVEKIPLFVLVVVLGVITFIVQQRVGAMVPEEKLSVGIRIANAFVSYLTYILKMVWPSRLAVLYPHPLSSLSLIRVVVCGLLLALMSVCLLWRARRYRYLAVGWLWYVGTLVPVIGLVQVGSQAMADRYTYIPLTGLFVIIAWGVSELAAKRPGLRVVAALSAVAVLLAAVTCTRLQLRHWQNSFTLFEHTLDVTSENWLMHNNYANVLAEMGKVDEAIDHFYKALRIRPNHAKVHNNLGNALDKLGKIDEAIEHYNKALKLEPNFSQAHYNLGSSLAKQGKLDEAIREFRESLRLEPDNADALSDLGFALAQQGSFDEAVKHYRKAIELEPTNVVTHGRFGLALSSQGRVDEAMEKFRFVLTERPDDAEMHCNMGVLLEQQGKAEQAMEHYIAAVQSDPNHFGAHNNLAIVLYRRGRIDEAIPHFRHAIRLDPDYVGAHKNLGIALTSQGKGGEAIPHFRKVLQFRPGDADVHHNLAVALMGRGLIDEAISEFREALRLKPDHKQARKGLETALEKQEDRQ